MPELHVTRRALQEALDDWRYEMRGRSVGARALACLRVMTAVTRVFGRAVTSLEENPFRHIGRDVCYAVRSLSRSPGFTLFSVGSLAAGLTITTAVCSLMIASFLTPLNVPNVDRLVNLNRLHSGARVSRKFFSWTEYLALKRADAIFASVNASGPSRGALIGLGTSEEVNGEELNGDYFNALGVGAEIGRVLQPSDDRPDAPPVVVLSDRIWRNQFAADPDIVGKAVEFEDTFLVVAGVASPSFHGTEPVFPAALWVTFSAIPRKNWSSLDWEAQPSVMIRGLLRPGVSVDQASTVVGAIGRALDEAAAKEPTTGAPSEAATPGQTIAPAWYVVPTSHVYRDESQDGMLEKATWAVVGLVGLVLLVACSNLANLALARGAGRRHELAVRIALGATRWRLMREQLVECACVTLLALSASLWAARGLMTWILNGLLSNTAGLLRTIDVVPHINMTMAMVAACGALTSFVVAGLWPSWQLTRASVRDALASDTPSNTSLLRWKGRTRLISGQVVCSVMIVSMAVLVGQQIVSSRASNSGMRLDGLAVANLSYPRHLHDENGERRTLDDLLERMRQQPGIASASLIGQLDVSEGAKQVWMTAPDRPTVKSKPMPLVSVTPDAFGVLGIPTRRGRTFDAHDTHDAPPVAILSETAARALFDTTDALGRTVAFEDTAGSPPSPSPTKAPSPSPSPSSFGASSGRSSSSVPPSPPIAASSQDGSTPVTVQATVIGVVGDIRPSASGYATGLMMYVPYAQTSAGFVGTVGIILRAGNPDQALRAMREHVRAIDPELGVVNAGVVLARWEGPLAQIETVGLLASALGGLALILAMAGLYGVLSHMVLRRRREIGIRMALGADRTTVLRMVLRQGLRPVVQGVVVGLFVEAIVRLVLRSLLIWAGPANDLYPLAIVPIPFLLAAMVACVLPARRASKVDPNVALREL
jgi:predicted permease